MIVNTLVVILMATLLQLAGALSGLRQFQDDAERDCTIQCTREYVPVCDSNGQLHANLCLFDVAVCLNPQLTQEKCKDMYSDE
ncbi:putative Kazal domain-containing protein [Plasmopara halstedii]